MNSRLCVPGGRASAARVRAERHWHHLARQLQPAASNGVAVRAVRGRHSRVRPAFDLGGGQIVGGVARRPGAHGARRLGRRQLAGRQRRRHGQLVGRLRGRHRAHQVDGLHADPPAVLEA